MKRIVLELEDHDADFILKSAIEKEISIRSGINQSVKATVVEEGFVIAKLEDKLKVIRELFKVLQESGFTKKVLRNYVLQETRIPQRDYDIVLEGILDFFRLMK